MRTSARSNGWRFDKSSDSGSRPSATEMFLVNRPNFPFGDFFSCSGTSLRLVFRIWKNLSAVSVKLARLNSLPSGDCENGNGCPNEVHKRGRIRSIKNCVCSQEEAAADVQELKRRGMSFPFPSGDHRIRHKQSCRSHPSNRIKPKVIVHASLI